MNEHFGEVVNHAKKALEAAKSIAVSEKELGMILSLIYSHMDLLLFCCILLHISQHTCTYVSAKDFLKLVNQRNHSNPGRLP